MDWGNLLKTGLQIGGDMLLPGAGTLGAGLVDAAIPAEETTPVNGEAQDKGGINTQKLLEVGLGQSAQLLAPLFAPKQEVMAKDYQKNMQWAQGGTNGTRY